EPLSPLTLNQFLYGNANPVMNVDPSGNFTLAEALTTVAIVADLATVGITSYRVTRASLQAIGGEITARQAEREIFIELASVAASYGIGFALSRGIKYGAPLAARYGTEALEKILAKLPSLTSRNSLKGYFAELLFSAITSLRKNTQPYVSG